MPRWFVKRKIKWDLWRETSWKAEKQARCTFIRAIRDSQVNTCCIPVQSTYVVIAPIPICAVECQTLNYSRHIGELNGPVYKTRNWGKFSSEERKIRCSRSVTVKAWKIGWWLYARTHYIQLDNNLSPLWVFTLAFLPCKVFRAVLRAHKINRHHLIILLVIQQPST